MNLEAEVAAQVYRMMDLHGEFSHGSYKEMNDCYSEKFQGWLYMPKEDEVQFFNVEQIRQGNKAAAAYYKGKSVKFNYSGLHIIPQSEKQAAVSYEITYQHNEKIVSAISMEVWRKEPDEKWRMIRWYEEKGSD